MRRVFYTFLIFVLVWLDPGTPASAQDTQQNETESYAVEDVFNSEFDGADYPFHDADLLQDGYRDIKRNDAYQFELAEVIPPKPQSALSRAIGRFFELIFRVLAPILEIAFWLGLGALILGALYLIGRAVYETRFARAPKSKDDDTPDIPLYQPAQAQARILLEEVDKLASEGRYGEAVHVLLFRSIQDIDRNRPNIVRRSLTAREIGQLSILTQNARQAFSTIAGVSELSHFGGTPIGQAGFETARRAYADLTGQTNDAPARSTARRRRT